MVSVSLRNPGITRVDFAGRSIKDIQPFNMSCIQRSSVSFADLWGCKCVSANFQIVVTSLLIWTPTRRSHNTIEYTSAVIHDVTDVNTTSMVLFPFIIISVTFSFPFLLMHSIEGLSSH